MKRMRGRRIALLLASVLPLLAEDDAAEGRAGAAATLTTNSRIDSGNSRVTALHENGNSDHIMNAVENSGSSEHRPLHTPSAAADVKYENDFEDAETKKTNSGNSGASATLRTISSSFAQPETRTPRTTWSIPSWVEGSGNLWSALEDGNTIDNDDMGISAFDNVVLPLRPFPPPWTNASSKPTASTIPADNKTRTTERTITISDTAKTAKTELPQPPDKEEKDSVETSDGSEISRQEVEKPVAADPPKDEKQKQQQQQQQAPPRVVVDYASKSAGALVLESSANFEGTSNLLTKNKDQYAIVPCQQNPKTVVIGLSEDILVKQIVLANYERYSSPIRDFHVAGSTIAMTPEDDKEQHWMDLGTYTAEPKLQAQKFNLKDPSWARYLKFSFLTHYGDEHYCTISQISVHGSTMLQGFHEQWVEQEKEDQNQEEKKEDAPLVKEGEKDKEAVANIAAAAAAAADKTTTSICSNGAYCVTNQLNDLEERMRQKTLDDAALETTTTTTTDTLACASIRLSGAINSQLGIHHTAKWQEMELRGARLSSVQPVGLSQPLLVNATETSSVTRARGGDDATSFVCWTSMKTISPVLQRIRSQIEMTPGIDTILDDDKVDRSGYVRPASDNSDKKQHPTVIDTATDDEVSEEPSSSEVPSNAVAGRTAEDGTVVEDEPESGERAAAPVEATAQTEKSDAVPVDPKEAITDKREEAVPKDPIKGTEASLANALKRLPSSECLKELDFVGFKAKFLASRTPGSSSGGNTSGNAMEPIFKKLTDEIKALQASVAVHDMYATESVRCYQRIILDLMVEMEELRLSQEARLLELEKNADLIARFNTWIIQWVGLVRSFCEWMIVQVEWFLYEWLVPMLRTLVPKILSFYEWLVLLLIDVCYAAAYSLHLALAEFLSRFTWFLRQADSFVSSLTD